jgi:phosphate transport system substrate-binding protein
MPQTISPSRDASRRRVLGLAGAALALPALARAVVPQRIRIGGTGSALGGMVRLGEALLQEGTGPGVHLVRNLGTAGGLRALIAGAIDISFAARELDGAERQRGLERVFYATTPLVFATHPATPVSAVTEEEAAALIAGNVRAWPNGTPVRVSRRPSDDSDTRLLAAISPVMGAAVAVLQARPGLPTASTDHDQASVLETVPGSFGVVALSLLRSEQRALKVVELAGRDPSRPDWPMQKRLFAIRMPEPDPAVLRFFEELQKPMARGLLATLGHLPQAAGG